MKKKTPGDNESNGQKGWLIVSGIAFLITLLAACILVFKGEELENIGIVGNIYYIILVPLGFSSAAFLGGAMKSYASFTSNESFRYGKLHLTGPIVIFALVVGGGFVLPRLDKNDFFDLKFRVVEKGKTSDLLNDGKLILYVGKEPKTANINDGEAIFYNIPEEFGNKRVKILPVIENYQLADHDQVLITKDDNYIDIELVRTEESLNTQVRGSIINSENIPVKNAFLNFGSGLASCYTNQNGDFFLTVPLPEGERISLKVLIDNVVEFDESVTLSSGIPINLKL